MNARWGIGGQRCNKSLLRFPHNTIIVIVTVAVVGVFVWLLDFLFTNGLMLALDGLAGLL